VHITQYLIASNTKNPQITKKIRLYFAQTSLSHRHKQDFAQTKQLLPDFALSFLVRFIVRISTEAKRSGAKTRYLLESTKL
jgi:hypothetical protein